MDLNPVGIRGAKISTTFKFAHCARLLPLPISYFLNDAAKCERDFIVRINLK
jgi:hypothetical protein